MNTIETKLKEQLQTVLTKLGLTLSLDEIEINATANREHGDYASNVALKNARKLNLNPRDFASKIVEAIDKSGIDHIEIAGPGFLNFFLVNDALTPILKSVLEKDSDYGRLEDKHQKINVEFVSANPTGELHLGHARCAAVGDSICRLLSFAGYDVTREFYVNDAGNQINNLGLSLRARYHQVSGDKEYPFPEDGYHAGDITRIANEFKDEFGDKYLVDNPENLKFITEYGMKKELDQIKKDLKTFRVVFDIYSSERVVRANNRLEKLLNEEYKDHLYQNENATFLKTTDYLDDKDRVVVKSDGSYTYLLPDIAYHLNKLSRGFDLLIDVLGADHHGYINRLKSSLMMKGYEPDVLSVELVQIVRLIENGKELVMSKRTGTGVSLVELCEMVGVDAARYFFVSRAASSHLDFDLDLAREQSSANPVYYGQYAYARLMKVLSLASDIDLTINAELLTSESEIALIKTLGEFPLVVESAASKRAPHLICNYIQKVAQLVHGFYTACRILDRENIVLTSARLGLCKASSIVLKNAFTLIGVSAPEKM